MSKFAATDKVTHLEDAMTENEERNLRWSLEKLFTFYLALVMSSLFTFDPFKKKISFG